MNYNNSTNYITRLKNKGENYLPREFYYPRNNLVLIQSFPANETLSAGLIEFLKQFFEVHFINLPGFHPSVPPIDKIDLLEHASFVKEKIKSLNLDRYYLAGFSYGCAVINNMNLDSEKCLGIIESEPFINKNHLQSKNLNWLIRLFLFTIIKLKLENYFWKSTIFKKFLLSGKNTTNGEAEIIASIIINEIDARTFFSVGYQLLTYKKNPIFNNKIPYILIINLNDKVINSEKVIRKFLEKIENNNLRIVFTKAPHYPPDPSFEFFNSVFSDNEVEAILNFFQLHLRDKNLRKNNFSSEFSATKISDALDDF